MTLPKPWEKNIQPELREFNEWQQKERMKDEPPQFQSNGRFLPGNRVSVGNAAGRRFNSGEELWAAFVDYMQWVEDNPLREEVVFSAREGIRRTTVAKKRAPTMQGFADHVGILHTSISAWRKREDLKDAMTMIDTALYARKFEGAAAGLFNPSIIARQMGLYDKQVVQHENLPKPTFEFVPIQSGTYLPPEESDED